MASHLELRRSKTGAEIGRNHNPSRSKTRPSDGKARTDPRSLGPRHCSPTFDGGGVATDGSYIKVVARIRPFSSKELHSNEATNGIEVREDRMTVDAFGQEHGQRVSKTFGVDLCIDSRDKGQDQQAFFQAVALPYVAESVSGYPVSFIAYGQTGSGKTYSILGDGMSLRAQEFGPGSGVIPRFLWEFDSCITGVKEYTCAFFEVYNDKIRDLLCDPEEKAEREVHMHPRFGPVIEGLRHAPTSCIEDVMKWVKYGNQMRTACRTSMNERSSRSHGIFEFRYGGERVGVGPRAVTFADLAGREDSGAIGHTAQAETALINKGLMFLSQLIQKIPRGLDSEGWADFRNTKLTMVLAHSLRGDAKTVLFSTLSPSMQHYEESVRTLQFADHCKHVQIKPRIASLDHMSDVFQEVKRLKQELSTTSFGDRHHQIRHELAVAEAIVARHAFVDEEKERMLFARAQCLARYGLHDHDQLDGPHLTNMGSDPIVRGAQRYSLQTADGSAVVIGSDETCGIRVHGLGIEPRMCEIQERRTAAGARCVVQALCTQPHHSAAAPRILINGSHLSMSTHHVLRHGDRLWLGRSLCFVYLDRCDDTVDLDIHSASQEIRDLDYVQRAEDYFEHLRHRGFSDIDGVARSFRLLCPFVEEANAITSELLYPSDLVFEMHALVDVFNYKDDKPELVICVIWTPQQNQVLGQNAASMLTGGLKTSSEPQTQEAAWSRPHDPWPQRFPGDALMTPVGLHHHLIRGAGHERILYVWNVERFLSRLHELRELYEESLELPGGVFAVRERLAADAFLDPWHEIEPDRARGLRAENDKLLALEEGLLRHEDHSLRAAQAQLAAQTQRAAGADALAESRAVELEALEEQLEVYQARLAAQTQRAAAAEALAEARASELESTERRLAASEAKARLMEHELSSLQMQLDSSRRQLASALAELDQPHVQEFYPELLPAPVIYGSAPPIVTSVPVYAAPPEPAPSPPFPSSPVLAPRSIEAAGGRISMREEVHVLREPQLGAVVMRGPDWSCGNQDGGLGSIGEVVAVRAEGMVTVRWQSGGVGDYRCGTDGAFDLFVVGEVVADRSPSPSVSCCAAGTLPYGQPTRVVHVPQYALPSVSAPACRAASWGPQPVIAGPVVAPPMRVASPLQRAPSPMVQVASPTMVQVASAARCLAASAMAAAGPPMRAASPVASIRAPSPVPSIRAPSPVGSPVVRHRATLAPGPRWASPKPHRRVLALPTH